MRAGLAIKPSVRKRSNPFPGLAVAVLVAVALLMMAPPTFAACNVERGKYLFAVAGCAGCHTDKKSKGALLAGGRKLATPFGVFYSPNITPDPGTGIGRWRDADFIRALREGIAPDGSHYFPVFPYPSYTGMTDADLTDIKAYIFTLPAIAKANKPHQVTAPFGWRFLLPIWKALYFSPGPFRPDAAKGQEWNRGAYLVNAVGHCGECHTPRDALGGKKTTMALAGTSQGPEGGLIPNITPDKQTGIGRWPDADLEELLQTGMLPDGDFVGSEMGEVVDQATSRLSGADRKAIMIYLRSLPAVNNKVESKKSKKNK